MKLLGHGTDVLADTGFSDNLKVIYSNGIHLSVEFASERRVDNQLNLEPSVFRHGNVLADHRNAAELTLFVKPISSLRATSMHKNFHCHNELLERPKCYGAAQE